MTIVDFIARFRLEADDLDSTDYLFTDTQIITLANDSVEEACKRKKLIFDSDTADICEVYVYDTSAKYDLDPSVQFISKAYLVDGDGIYTYLDLYSRDELDLVDSLWRENTGTPARLIVGDKDVQIVPAPAAGYTMHLEVYRTPTAGEKMVAYVVAVPPAVQAAPTEPIIAAQHHPYLHHWALHVAFSRRNLDKYSPALAADHLQKFEDYFGPRPDANRNKRSRENRPPRNKLW